MAKSRNKMRRINVVKEVTRRNEAAFNASYRDVPDDALFEIDAEQGKSTKRALWVDRVKVTAPSLVPVNHDIIRNKTTKTKVTRTIAKAEAMSKKPQTKKKVVKAVQYDLWGSETKRGRVAVPAANRAVVNVPAAGASYRPSVDAHVALLARVVAEEESKHKDWERKRQLHAMVIPKITPSARVAEEVVEPAEPIDTSRISAKQRRRKVRHLREMDYQARRKAMRVKGQKVKDLGPVVEQLLSEQQDEVERDIHCAPPVVPTGPSPTESFQLPSETAATYRTMRKEGHLMKDRMDSLVQRAMAPERQAGTFRGKRVKKTKEFVKKESKKRCV
ncbi:ribosome biogenesis protein Nop53/GLTSCR2 [Kipferlia bialata]|uniref:Ribosome biogenesis protein NOP53 n=1 Tax=Kipferlia bialata TaxID=797122 RepID=A0A391NX25_9EUKA|nr:ribosome biogenesis protein Nop53/GLTSCR2 [Kipferlia bialata]|eukprot:g7496.t1